MPLPQQVINQLSREPAKTPGWSGGILFFSGGVFIVCLLIWGILSFGYQSYLESQTKELQDQITQVAQSISSDDQAKLISFYSQITNLKGVLQNHIIFSQFLDWLAKNTEANVAYGQLTYGSATQVTLNGTAKSEADINQQVAIFESSPMVKSVSVTNVSLANNGSGWMFSMGLNMNPAIFKTQTVAATPTTPVTPTQ